VNERLLTLGEVASELRCSVATVKRRIRAGDLAAFTDGRLVRVREADLRRYIVERVARRLPRGRPMIGAGHDLPSGARLWD
jgi:excisionase family DNA binding protein